MKKVFALMFAIALSISMSSFAFAQDDKKQDAKPMDKMEKPMDKQGDTAKAKHHHHKHHKKENKDDMKKAETK